MNDLTIPSRSVRLKTSTQAIHSELDQRIMSSQPFASRSNFADFLCAQFLFLNDTASVYQRSDIAALLPDLYERRRTEAIAADLADLGVAAPVSLQSVPQIGTFATALGWLYVVEGSKLGAAILLKHAAVLGLNENFGARHLGAHDDGRARHWRAFVEVLDAAVLDVAGEDEVVQGAIAAFNRMNAHLDQMLAGAASSNRR